MQTSRSGFHDGDEKFIAILALCVFCILLGFYFGKGRAAEEYVQGYHDMEVQARLDSVIISKQLAEVIELKDTLKHVTDLYYNTRDELWDCLPNP